MILEVRTPLLFCSISPAALEKRPLIGHLATSVWFHKWSFGPLFDVTTLCGQGKAAHQEAFLTLVPDRLVDTVLCERCAKSTRRPHVPWGIEWLVPREGGPASLIEAGWRSVSTWDWSMITALKTWTETDWVAQTRDRQLKGPRTKTVQALIDMAEALDCQHVVLQHEPLIHQLRSQDRCWPLWV